MKRVIFLIFLTFFQNYIFSAQQGGAAAAADIKEANELDISHWKNWLDEVSQSPDPEIISLLNDAIRYALTEKKLGQKELPKEYLKAKRGGSGYIFESIPLTSYNSKIFFLRNWKEYQSNRRSVGFNKKTDQQIEEEQQYINKLIVPIDNFVQKIDFSKLGLNDEFIKNFDKIETIANKLNANKDEIQNAKTLLLQAMPQLAQIKRTLEFLENLIKNLVQISRSRSIIIAPGGPK